MLVRLQLGRDLLVVGILAALGAWGALPAKEIGCAVPTVEGRNLMGGACYNQTETDVDVCYGVSCIAGGCGCRTVKEIVPGLCKNVVVAQPCFGESTICVTLNLLTCIPCSP